MTLVIPKTKIISYTHHERARHQAWCLDNDITIYYDPINNFTGRIIVEQFGNIPEIGCHIYKSNLKKLNKKDDNWSVIIMKLYTEKYLEYYEEQDH